MPPGVRVPSTLLLLSSLHRGLVSLPVYLLVQQLPTAAQAVLHLLPTSEAILQLAVRGGATIAQPPVYVRVAWRFGRPWWRVESWREGEGGGRVAKDALLA